MEDKHRQQLLEEYEEAALKLWMDEYAELEGERLWKEYQEAEEKGEVPEISEELDKKCMQLIASSFRKKKRKRAFAHLVQSASRIAACLCIILLCSSVVVLSVEAFRVPVINFFLRMDNRYSSLIFDEPVINTETRADELKKLSEIAIPVEYNLVMHETYDSGRIIIIYQNSSNKKITIKVSPSNGELNFDTENAQQIEMDLCGHTALFVEKDGLRVIWLNAEEDVTFDLFADGLSEDLFWELAFLLAE